MTQPSYVPIAEVDQTRPALRLSTPRSWTQARPAELLSPKRPRGRGAGVPGPDQGYAMLLAHRFSERLVLVEGEDPSDVLLGAALVATARSGHYGRAPVARDVELALGLFGYLSPAPDELVEWRRSKFGGIAHDYSAQRELVDGIPEGSLLLDPGDAKRRAPDEWRELLGASGASGAPSAA